MTLVQNKDASSETPPPRRSSPSGFDWNALRRKVTQWCRRALCRRRVVWFALGLAAAAATALGELSQLLADIASEGEVSYSAAVFTSFTLAPFEAGHELADAVRLWCPSDGLSPCWLGYVDL
jgi:anti-sigma factor RsiW